MRSVPSAVSDGFTNNYRAFWVVKVEGSGSHTYYWTTTAKNRTGHTYTLKWDSGTTVTGDATMIAARDLVSGEEYDGIGAMEAGANMYEGGGVAAVSDVMIQVLNQDRFDETVMTHSVNLENRPISIYFGFIPDGSGQTVIISTEMLLRWAGVIEDVMEFDYQTFVLRCVDGSFQRHEDMPSTIITATDYAKAPKESIGKVIPILYGAFYVDADTEVVARDFMTLSPVPAIMTDETSAGFIVADHEISELGEVYTYNQQNNIFGILPAPDNESNTAAGATFDYASGGVIVATFRQVPYGLDSTNTATNPENAVDGTSTTHTHVGKDCGDLYRLVPRPQEFGTLVDSAGSSSARVAVRAYIGNVADSENNKIFLVVGVESVHTITDADIDTVIDGTNTTDFTWDLFASTYFGVFDNAAAAMVVEVQHIVVEYYVVVANMLRSGTNLGIRPFKLGG